MMSNYFLYFAMINTIQREKAVGELFRRDQDGGVHEQRGEGEEPGAGSDHQEGLPA